MFKVGAHTALEGVKEFDPENLTSGQLDTLIAMVENGPLFDGDVPSKVARDELMDNGYAVKVACKGEASHNAANDKGCTLYAKHFGCDTISEAMKKRKEAVIDARDPGDHEFR